MMKWRGDTESPWKIPRLMSTEPSESLPRNRLTLLCLRDTWKRDIMLGAIPHILMLSKIQEWGILSYAFLLTTLLLWLEFHYRMLGFLEKVLTDFALHGLPW